MKEFQILAACVIVALAVFCGSKDSALDDMIQVEDGVTVVRNSMEPVKAQGGPTGLVLEKNLRIGIAEGDENYMFAEVRSVQVDEERRYILSFFHGEEEYIFVIKDDQVYTMCPEDEESIPHVTRYTMNWQYE